MANRHGHGNGHGNGALVLAPPLPRHIPPPPPLPAPHFCYDEHDNAGGYGYADESAHAAVDAYEQHTRSGNGHGVLSMVTVILTLEA